jgi:hypothetical protein
MFLSPLAGIVALISKLKRAYMPRLVIIEEAE